MFLCTYILYRNATVQHNMGWHAQLTQTHIQENHNSIHATWQSLNIRLEALATNKLKKKKTMNLAGRKQNQKKKNRTKMWICTSSHQALSFERWNNLLGEETVKNLCMCSLVYQRKWRILEKARSWETDKALQFPRI